MSTHTFKSGPHDIQCGWDRPLQYFYLNVVHDETCVYAQLNDPSAQTGPFGGGLNIKQLADKFTELGITPPDGLLGALRYDQHTNAGNQSVQWEPAI